MKNKFEIDHEGIILDDVGFSYGKKEIFESINFCIPKGEIWALLGQSGVGKTTLLHVIAGLYKAEKGNININGRSAFPGCIRGIVFQDESLLGWLTAEKNLLFPDHLNPSSEKRKKVKEILDAIGLVDYFQYYPYELSAGMRKRLEFARALIVDKEFILADEPFGTVDAVTRRNLWDLWSRLRKKEPRTGILCTHDPEEAIRLCDVILTLRAAKPTLMGERIQIPDDVKHLPLTEENSEFWYLKKRIIKSLVGNQNGA